VTRILAHARVEKKERKRERRGGEEREREEEHRFQKLNDREMDLDLSF